MNVCHSPPWRVTDSAAVMQRCIIMGDRALRCARVGVGGWLTVQGCCRIASRIAVRADFGFDQRFNVRLKEPMPCPS